MFVRGALSILWIVWDHFYGLSENKYQIYEDRAIGLTEAILELKAGDILVVLGKGRENYQEVMGEKLPHSDLEIIESFINAD